MGSISLIAGQTFADMTNYPFAQIAPLTACNDNFRLSAPHEIPENIAVTGSSAEINSQRTACSAQPSAATRLVPRCAENAPIRSSNGFENFPAYMSLESVCGGADSQGLKSVPIHVGTDVFMDACNGRDRCVSNASRKHEAFGVMANAYAATFRPQRKRPACAGLSSSVAVPHSWSSPF